jgi:hypothetical protein
MKKAIFALLASCSIASACQSEAGTPYPRSLAGQVGFEHFECWVAAYDEQERFRYRIVFRTDIGARERVKLMSGGEITRLPILEAEVIRPDNTRHELIKNAVPQDRDGIIDFMGRGYYNLVEQKLTIADDDGPLKGEGAGLCMKVQPSQASDW